LRLYVDNIILIASSPYILCRITMRLSSELAMTNLGAFHHFLDVFVTCSSYGLFLSQPQYAVELLQHAGMSECHPTTTSMGYNSKLSATDVP
jgi:hypothetical protein